MLAKIILVGSCLPVLVAAVYAALTFRSQGKAIKLFSVFLFLSAVMQVVSGLIWWFKINNQPLLHLYVAAGYVCLSLFYRELFRTFLNGNIMLILAAVFVLAAIGNAIYLQPLTRHCSHTLTAESVLVIIFSLFTFILLLRDISNEFGGARKTISWINTGLFVYYASSLLIFYFSDIMARALPVYINQYTWVLHSVFSMFMYTCFIIALWKHPKNSAS